MFSIKLTQNNDGCEVILFLDDEQVESWWFGTPVEVAMKVRQLTEDYMGIGE